MSISNQQSIPRHLQLHQKSRILEIVYDERESYNLPCEFLRVYSPSAEVRGHGAEQVKLVVGKSQVNIAEIKPVGHYAVQLVFSDGHDSGIYSWAYLYTLCQKQHSYWQRYLDKLEAAGASRDADIQILELDARN